MRKENHSFIPIIFHLTKFSTFYGTLKIDTRVHKNSKFIHEMDKSNPHSHNI
jgi:hypothetical protein